MFTASNRQRQLVRISCPPHAHAHISSRARARFLLIPDGIILPIHTDTRGLHSSGAAKSTAGLLWAPGTGRIQWSAAIEFMYVCTLHIGFGWAQRRSTRGSLHRHARLVHTINIPCKHDPHDSAEPSFQAAGVAIKAVAMI